MVWYYNFSSDRVNHEITLQKKSSLQIATHEDHGEGSLHALQNKHVTEGDDWFGKHIPENQSRKTYVGVEASEQRE